MENRQLEYTRRASQHDDLAESRSRHELFRSSMFSTGSREQRPSGSRAFQRGSIGGGGEGGSSGESSEDTTAARIDAAIKAAMAVDSTRGANTFPFLNFTPPGSVGGSGHIGAGGGPAAGGGGQHMTSDHNSAGTYRTYHPATTNAPSFARNGSPGYTSATRYPTRSVAPVDDSVESTGSMGRRSGSGASLGGSGHVHGYRGSGGSGGGGGDLAAGGAAEPPSYNNGGGARAGHGRGVGSGGSGGSARGASAAAQKQQQQHQHQHQQQRWSTGEWGAVAPTPRAMWQPEPPAVAMTRAYEQQQESTGSSDGFSSEDEGGGKGAGPGTARGETFQNQLQKSRRDFSEHINADSSGAIAPPQQWSPDIPPVETSGTGGGSLDHGGGAGHGGGEGVALTPAGYSEPLELPDGCHHISLAKFLEVMTGPGLRVRKHHRAGKGSSGLRVLRYSEEGDSLTWDSHKILGAAQHVLPMNDVESVSMHPGNRVVLLCVGGKDSYAVFEAANDDAAAVLYVGLERLRERTRSRREQEV